MFEGQNNNPKEAIKLDDTEENIFLQFMEFLYTDSTRISAENFGDLLCCAKKYETEMLSVLCKESLKTFINSDMVCQMMEFAYLFNDPGIMDICLEAIELNTPNFLHTDAFMKMCSTSIYKITQHDRIFAPENLIFQQICKWSEEECVRQELPVTAENQRTVLGDILYEVRFPIMSHQFLDDVVCESNILSDKVQILRRQLKTKNTEMLGRFKSHRRIWKPKTLMTSRLLQKTRTIECFNGKRKFQLKFCVSSYSVLVGIHMEHIRQRGAKDIKIIGSISPSHSDDDRSTQFSIDLCQIENKMMMLYPQFLIPLRKDINYTLSIAFDFRREIYRRSQNSIEIECNEIEEIEESEFNGKRLSIERFNIFQYFKEGDKGMLIAGLYLNLDESRSAWCV
ncbi:BTB/POZ domain-containing protein 2-like [Saccostrea echinata]|uniref:BTB/POZ domain-containing protein 2-like n=1 Tax=Saccostrea echinata TaxID=191078 RepID=UPI002A838BDE|nr:BTB/POZ domain-containing protein 2-like [Saccostrea echinata]